MTAPFSHYSDLHLPPTYMIDDVLEHQIKSLKGGCQFLQLWIAWHGRDDEPYAKPNRSINLMSKCFEWHHTTKDMGINIGMYNTGGPNGICFSHSWVCCGEATSEHPPTKIRAPHGRFL